MSFIEMRASEQIRRWISSLFDISSEKNATGCAGLARRRDRHIERERRLAHARTGGDDDEVARLEAGRHRVDVAEARGQARAIAAHVKEPVDAVERFFQQAADRHELRHAATLADLVDDLLARDPAPRERLLRLRTRAA